MKKLFLIAITSAFLVLVPACSSGPPTGQVTAPASTSVNSVSISNFAFSPAKLTVTTGTSVTWTNNDNVAHTVTSSTGAFDSGSIAPGASFSHVFNATGTYDYNCSVHTYMKGTVTVQ